MTNSDIWYLQIFRSNFFAEPRILRLNKELQVNTQFVSGLYNYLQLCMVAVEDENHSIEYDLGTLDIILGYDDTRLTSGFIELLIRCKLAILINDRLELYLANSTILSKTRYDNKKARTAQKREEYKKTKATPTKEVANVPDIDSIPF